jgi:hypothetical protein
VNPRPSDSPALTEMFEHGSTVNLPFRYSPHVPALAGDDCLSSGLLAADSPDKFSDTFFGRPRRNLIAVTIRDPRGPCSFAVAFTGAFFGAMRGLVRTATKRFRAFVLALNASFQAGGVCPFQKSNLPVNIAYHQCDLECLALPAGWAFPPGRHTFPLLFKRGFANR